MLTATATAHLTELYSRARPRWGPRRAEVVSTAADIGGLGLGPLASGVLAEYVPSPLFTPYFVFALLLVIGALLLLAVPETVQAPVGPWVYRP
ncbi:hypothetical protein F8G81_12925 [Arthrobacter sp. CDRTa11]|uniref:hypothetical protein n=1 Tax=Arthrobacter sp. CDRTa11 TaxID=2651199 RepID=UPI002265DA10|nr:hypothetical protein [Arthrobacter sp. CDRTa11]UZX03414.1 hypothetical protein F8G81_12925 [Arthrobacter sp. CDRTa11]